MLIKTNWIIITGAPRSGKTKLVERLAFNGWNICPEISRILLDEALSRNELFNNRTVEFEKNLFQEKRKAEARFDPSETVIWDRSPIDSLAFSQLYHKNLENEFVSKLKYQYKYVFYLCSLPQFIPDYATFETEEEAYVLGCKIKNCYKQLGYNIIEVPVTDIKSRAEFVMEKAHLSIPEYESLDK